MVKWQIRAGSAAAGLLAVGGRGACFGGLVFLVLVLVLFVGLGLVFGRLGVLLVLGGVRIPLFDDLLVVAHAQEDLERAGDDLLALLKAGEDDCACEVAGADLHGGGDGLA